MSTTKAKFKYLQSQDRAANWAKHCGRCWAQCRARLCGFCSCGKFMLPQCILHAVQPPTPLLYAAPVQWNSHKKCKKRGHTKWNCIFGCCMWVTVWEERGRKRHEIIFSHRPPWLALFKICAKNAEGPSHKSKIATLAIYMYLHCVYDTFDDQINCNAAMHKTRHSRGSHTHFF